MLFAPIPADDEIRLERLRSTGLLNTHPEERPDWPDIFQGACVLG